MLSTTVGAFGFALLTRSVVFVDTYVREVTSAADTTLHRVTAGLGMMAKALAFETTNGLWVRFLRLVFSKLSQVYCHWERTGAYDQDSAGECVGVSSCPCCPDDCWMID